MERKALEAFARSVARRTPLVTLEARGGYKAPRVPALKAAWAEGVVRPACAGDDSPLTTLRPRPTPFAMVK